MSLTFLYLRDKAETLKVDIGMVGAIKNSTSLTFQWFQKRDISFPETGAEIVVLLRLRRVWRGHLYLSADARMLAPPSFSITTITQSLY